MKKDFNQIYQFKITLEGIRPPIWRRIQVPETHSFRDLHPEHEEMLEWIGGEFDPEYFDVSEIRFRGTTTPNRPRR
jgi:hypothetical protein